jgi:endogenous inhibitor of DNA gyrase (YacG/DUF329 family)
MRAVNGENAQRCPICGAPARQETRPFCSRRCRDVDLARWLSGSYVIGGGERGADEDGDAPHGTPKMPPEEQAGGSD